MKKINWSYLFALSLAASIIFFNSTINRNTSPQLIATMGVDLPWLIHLNEYPSTDPDLKSEDIQNQTIQQQLIRIQQLQVTHSLANCKEEKQSQQNIVVAKQALQKIIQSTKQEGSFSFMMAENDLCPEIQVLELQGIPGFSETDELVVCGAPDSLAFLIFIDEPGNISGTQMTTTLLPGMQYAGFEATHYAGTSISNLDPSLSKPKFLLEGITDGVYVAYLGVEATCEVNINAYDYIVDLDFTFIYEDTLGNFSRCRQTVTPDRTYNTIFREPVLNFRSVNALNITSLGTETCSNIQISQDGISAYLTEMEFSITNVDFDNEISITSLSANSIPIPYHYSPIDSTLTATLTGSYFETNTNANPADTLFNESEILTMRLCVQSDECPRNNIQYISYNAAYYCNGDTCQTTSRPSTISIQPTDRPTPIATSTLKKNPSICGDPGMIELILESSIADSATGIFTDVVFGYQTCDQSSLGIGRVLIGEMEIPSTYYSWTNGTLQIDLTTLNFDPDGTGGITDADQDGFMDDLPGGQQLKVAIELDFICALPPDPTSLACNSVDCSFGQFYVQAKRDCGTSFTSTPSVESFNVLHGATDVGFKDHTVINTTLLGYDFGVTRTTGLDGTCNAYPARVKTVEFCYVYERENINPCAAANTTNELQVVFDGSPILVNDINFVAGSGQLTVNGVTTQSGVTGTMTDLSVSTRVLNLPIGSLNIGDEVCYIYQLEADTAHCTPPVYMNGTHQVIETCTTAGCTCKIVKACDVSLFRSDPTNCLCDCDIYSGANIQRWNLGYTDASMSEKVKAEDVPLEDVNRYLPNDTMYYEGWMTFNSPESVGELYQWYFVANITDIGNNIWNGNDDTELMINSEGTELLGLEFSGNGDGGNRQPIDISSFSDCIDQPGVSGATGFFAYAGKTPWDDVISQTPICNSTYEYHDGNLFGVYFRNFNKLEDCRQTEVAGWEEVDCLDQIKDHFDIQVGDTIYMKWLLPLTKNVKAAANKLSNPNFNYLQPQILNVASGHFLDDFDSDCLVALSNCRENSAFQTFCPRDINAVTEITIDDCGGSVEHNFNVVVPTPVNWYTKEYRPYFSMQDIDIPMYSPLMYCGNARLVSKAGVEYPLNVQAMTNHTCANVDGQEYCTVSSGEKGLLTFNPYTDNYPGLGVGLGGYLDEFKLVYDLCKVCPAESSIPNDYSIDYTYRIAGDIRTGCFVCNQSTTNLSNELPNICGLNGNRPVDRLGNYYDAFNLDTLFVKENTSINKVISDISNGFAPLSQKLDRDLLSSIAPGISEEINTITVCADGSDTSLETHRGMLSSITLTNSVAFVNAYDMDMNPLAFDTVSVSASSTTYAVFLPNLAPGDSIKFKIGTSLLYCPIAPDQPKICITTTSGCMDRAVMAAVAGSTSACNGIKTCYKYIFEEAGIQADFLLPNAGEEFPLCEVIPMAVLVKNVRTTTVTDLVLDIDLPLDGLEIVSGSFEASYPNSGNFNLDFYPIDDPLITGNNLLYEEDNVFSNAIHRAGFPGVTSSADSNFILIQFLVDTKCDEFVSGSQAYFEARANDPCSPGQISSGLVNSSRIIIEGANPENFGQVLITANPSEAYCGQNTPTFKITGQNISEYPLGDSVITCITLPPNLSYQTNSMRFINPATLSVGSETVTMVNGQTQICFQGYENMPVGGAFTLNFEADFDLDTECGDYAIEIDIRNLVEDQVCTDGGVCDVYVQSTVNPTFNLTLKGPFETADLQVYRQCSDSDDPVTICYDAMLVNPGADYEGDITINLHDDLLANQLLDSYDPILGTSIFEKTMVGSGDTIVLSACFTMPAINACPVILDIVYESACNCDHEATPFKTIEPAFIATLPPTTILCPNQELGLEVCGEYTINFDPVANVVQRTSNDSLYISLIDPATITQINVTGTTGECSVNASRNIRSLEPFDVALVNNQTCENQPIALELTIPIAYQSDVAVQWIPATNLDDANRADPLFTSSIPGTYEYTVQLTFGEGCTLEEKVSVEVAPIGVLNITGNPTICYPYETNLLSADAGFDYYEWYLLEGGFEIVKASTTTEIWEGPTEPGNYLVKGFRSTDDCPSVSNPFSITQADCVDIELEKTICEIDDVPNIGDTISYQIVVCNRYAADSLLIHTANMVHVKEVLPAAVSYVNHSTTQGIYTPDGIGNWEVGSMPAGTCDTLKISVKLIDYGKIKNTSEVSAIDKEDIDSEEDNDDGDQSEDDEDMDMFTLEPFDLALKKILDPSTPMPIMMVGDTIKYCIIVENQGNVDAYHIKLAEHPPMEITPVDTNWTDKGTYWEYNAINSLLVGQKDTIKLVSILAAVPADTFAVNYAEIIEAQDIEGDYPKDQDSKSDTIPDNDGMVENDVTDNTNEDEDDHDPAVVYVGIVDLALKKTTDITRPVKVGEHIPYTITIYNQGNVPSTNILLSEYIPNGLDLN